MKKLSINNLELSFREIKLYQFKNNLENIFKDYKSKTISETINSKKYKNLKSVIENENDIIHKHLPFERYEGNPDFDVNSSGSGPVERKIPQVAHESHMWCVVETLSAHDIIHHTEKTFKPISVGHPFMVLGSVNQNKDLKKYGYELYDDIINYDFEEPDPNMFRYNAIEKLSLIHI